MQGFLTFACGALVTVSPACLFLWRQLSCSAPEHMLDMAWQVAELCSGAGQLVRPAVQLLQDRTLDVQ